MKLMQATADRDPPIGTGGQVGFASTNIGECKLK